MRRRYLYIIAIAWLWPTVLVAEESSAAPKVVIAKVGGEPIYSTDAERILSKVTRGREVNPASVPMLKAQVLAEIVDRRLILAYARRTKSGAGAEQVEAALAKLKSGLDAQGRSLNDAFDSPSITEADLRRQIAWNLTWKKFLARYVTDQRLQSHFKTRRREFDGTEVSVSHILLRPAADAGAEATAGLVERAATIRASIVSGKTSFDEAVGKHSAGPSGKAGGRLGFIARRGSMAEAFSRAAFRLEIGQISRPVVTRFGVHLIRCNRIKPGDKQWADVRGLLEEALARELIAKLARHERDHTPVEFTGKWPHFKPGSRELAGDG